MFKKKLFKPNLTLSDEGFSIETTRLSIKYIQGEKMLKVGCEDLYGPDADICVHAKPITKWESGEPIDEEEKKVIVDNICRALEFRKFKVDVIW